MASSGEITDRHVEDMPFGMGPRSRLRRRDDAVLQDTHLQPFPDQTDHPFVTDPMFQEADEPLLVDRIEERLDVGVRSV